MTCPEINNQTDLDLTPHQPLFDSFFPYSQKTMGYTKQPKLNFASDPENAGKALGKTAHYDPSSMEITIYVDGRHIKDILRSIAHELIHHAQNERGEFDRDFDTGPGYALKDGHMWNMEQEAYKDGNSCFRRWEDTYKQENQLEEQKMPKISIKKELKKMRKILNEQDYRDIPGSQPGQISSPPPPPAPGMSMQRQTPVSAADLAVGKPKKRRARRDPNVLRLQRQLKRIGALDALGSEIATDGIPGWRTASALASVSPGFQCIGDHCKGSVRYLIRAARSAARELANRSPMSEDEALQRTADAQGRGMDQTTKMIDREVATATEPIEKALTRLAALGGAEEQPGAAVPEEPEDDDDKLDLIPMGSSYKFKPVAVPPRDRFRKKDVFKERKKPMITIKKKDLVKLLTEEADYSSIAARTKLESEIDDTFDRAKIYMSSMKQARVPKKIIFDYNNSIQKIDKEIQNALANVATHKKVPALIRDLHAENERAASYILQYKYPEQYAKLMASDGQRSKPSRLARKRSSGRPPSTSADPGAAAATQRPSANRWAKRAKAGKAFKHRLAKAVQTELIKNMSVAFEESQVLTEQKRHPCTNAKTASGVDGWMGGATLKCLQSVPIFKGNKKVKNNLSVYKNMRGILRTLKGCTDEVQCVPTIGKAKAAPAAGAPEQPQPTTGERDVAGVVAQALTKRRPGREEPCEDYAGGNPAAMADCCKKRNTIYDPTTKQCKAKTITSLEESKSPLKPLRIKHYSDRNKRLFEHLIKKAK